jgi:hypothetical protein
MMKFPWMSPYVAFDNNPIVNVDPLGLYSEKRANKKAERMERKGYENVSVVQSVDKDGNKTDNHGVSTTGKKDGSGYGHYFGKNVKKSSSSAKENKTPLEYSNKPKKKGFFDCFSVVDGKDMRCYTNPNYSLNLDLAISVDIGPQAGVNVGAASLSVDAYSAELFSAGIGTDGKGSFDHGFDGKINLEQGVNASFGIHDILEVGIEISREGYMYTSNPENVYLGDFDFQPSFGVPILKTKTAKRIGESTALTMMNHSRMLSKPKSKISIENAGSGSIGASLIIGVKISWSLTKIYN